MNYWFKVKTKNKVLSVLFFLINVYIFFALGRNLSVFHSLLFGRQITLFFFFKKINISWVFFLKFFFKIHWAFPLSKFNIIHRYTLLLLLVTKQDWQLFLLLVQYFKSFFYKYKSDEIKRPILYQRAVLQIIKNQDISNRRDCE